MKLRLRGSTNVSLNVTLPRGERESVCVCPVMPETAERGAQACHLQGPVISFHPSIAQARVFICVNACFKGWSQLPPQTRTCFLCS